MSGICDVKKCIFIHIPKCVGTSITRVLVPDAYSHESIYGFYRDHSLREKIKSYFKWCFVRNPYDRFASIFYTCKRHGEVDSKYVESPKILADFLSERLAELPIDYYEGLYRDIFPAVHVIPQYCFVTIGGKLQMDFVGRFENLYSDFGALLCRFGLNSTELPHYEHNPHKPWQECLDAGTVDIVSKLYDKDFSLFNYSKV